MRSLTRVLTVGSIVLISMTTPVRGQHTSSIEPEAMSALTKMSEYLRSLKAFQVEAVTSKEDVLEDGQKVQFASVARMLARTPDRLHIAVDSDRHHREYFYDGKNFTLLARRQNLYATVAAPPTIGALADALD